MDITVVLCTYNRSQSLAKTLESISASTLPESIEWEVLVVDNNSTDRTGEVIEDFCRRHPGRFRYIFEPQAGKSHALNAGVGKAYGEILAFTDDDVRVESTWLGNLTAPLRGGKWVGVGGRTLPAHSFSRPAWLPLEGPYNMGGILALFDGGDQAVDLVLPPYGVNMAFERRVFEKHGAFRTDLGPSPNTGIPRPNEDTEFGRRLLASGQRLLYEPSAIVYHPVPENRLNQEYFLAWWFDYGRALIREKGEKPDVYGIPRYLLSLPKMAATYLSVKTLQWLLTFNPQKRFYYKSMVWKIAGEMVETYRQARSPMGENHSASQVSGQQFKVKPFKPK
jgi:glycosyltransferase involved in cell wall biosynthesis